MERENFIDGIPGTELLVSQETEHIGEDGEIILIPTPTGCKADPLSWPKFKRYWQLFVVSLYACTFAFGQNTLGAAWTQVSEDIGVNMDNMNGGSALNWLLLGFVNTLWIPMSMKLGRRPVFIATTLIALTSMIWIGKCNGTAQWFLAMILDGIGVAGYEAMIQLEIFDSFHVHERGRALAVYLFFQEIGAVIGLVAGGNIAATIGWRWSQYLVAIVDAFILGLFIFTFQETLFPRFLFERAEHTEYVKSIKSTISTEITSSEKQNIIVESNDNVESNDDVEYNHPKVTDFPGMAYWQGVLKWWVYFPEDKTTYWQYFRRPFILFTFPNIFFAGLMFGFGPTAGMLIFSTVAEILMDAPYNYSTTTTGLMCLGALIGSIISWFCGFLSDYVVIYLAKKNNGIKEPEMRLYTMILPFCFAAAGYMMFGWGAQLGDKWIVVSVGLGLMTAQQVSACSIATSYAMDCFRGISSELVVVLAICNACINFAASYSCQEFLTAVGYGWLFFFWGMLVMASCASAFIVIIYGKRWRKNSAEKYFKFVSEGKQ